jgi:hypothetical protein
MTINRPIANLFFNHGNRDAVEQVKHLRLGRIVGVNIDDMVAEIEFLEESSGKTRVPIPMPTAYPGGGIFAVPKAGALVLIGIRSMQMPIIIGYYPNNAYSPDSYFSISQQVFGIPDALAEGDIFMRAAADSAKCLSCGVVSSLTAWASNMDPTTLIERCPNCQTPAYTNDDQNLISQLNKVQLGTTLHIRSDGKIMIQGDNTAARENGDTDRLLKVVIDGVTGNVTVADAGDVNVSASGDIFLSGNKLTIHAAANLELQADTIIKNINNEDVESVLSKTITASDTILLAAETVTIQAAGISNVGADTRITTVVNSDTLDVGSDLTVSVGTGLSGGDRVFSITGNDTLDITLNRIVTIGGLLGETVTGGATLSIGGAQTVTVTGASSTTIGGARTLAVTGADTTTIGGIYSLTATGAASIISSAIMHLTGTNVILNNGTRAVARVNDTAASTAASDAAFWAFYNALIAFLSTFAADSTPFVASQAAAGVAAGLAASSINSVITSGNTTVKA